jgi:PadR family transcriptional regulator PadR
MEFLEQGTLQVKPQSRTGLLADFYPNRVWFVNSECSVLQIAVQFRTAAISHYARSGAEVSGLQCTRVDIRQEQWHSCCRMPTQPTDDRIALLQGTLDLLILKTLILGRCHGQGIARSIQRRSEEVFFVDHGSLYLGLQRLEDRRWIAAEWGVSENNRKARFYTLTPKGRKQLLDKTSEWQRLARAMGLVLADPEPGN